ncbi:MAG TPA: PhoPQ-activated pathogenicity-related family protein [Blastocatellia bacterium]|nr:PhoPQ-activated pathogenicity-related family protein [Blastocatellia bacterium]
MALIVFALLPNVATAQETALDRYIAKPDPAYAWKLANTIPGNGFRAYVLELTSQQWRTEQEVDRPLWKHWLTIIKPDAARHNTGLLYIGSGSNRDPAPTAPSPRTVDFAMKTNSVVAELGMVPNQPLHFADSKNHGRYEDDLIAYSRVKYIVTGDEEWLVRLAMVKSAVRAMDAVQEFLASEAGGRLKVGQFVVMGFSKRGWTTWLTGLVDKRVIAIMPGVIDALNTEVITRHHYEAYGFFSPALGDYFRHGLYPHQLGTPTFARILSIEDPFMYRHRERMKIPKFILNATGDQYFLPDNSRFYFGDLPQEKYLRYVPNTRHNLAESDAMESLIAFYESVLAGRKRPAFSWVVEKDGSIRLTAKDRPKEVNLWQATNPDARDFRLDTIGKAWKSSPLEEQGPGVYVARVSKPEKGFTAFFIEMVYESGGQYPFKFTTDVSVIPDILPFKQKAQGRP